MAGLVTGIVGLGISAGTTAVSFIQANNEKRKQADYEKDAATALAQARKALQVNYAKQMSIQKEPYNQERLALLSAGAQITQAASESERGAASAAGQLLGAQQMGAADITNRQTTDMQNIENAILEEESRLRDVGVGLDMQEIAGQQQAAADSRLAAAQANQAGMQGLATTAQAGLDMIPLYAQDRNAQRAAIGNISMSDTELQNFGNITANPFLGKRGEDSKSMIPASQNAPGTTNLDLGSVKNMSNLDYRRFKRELTPEQKRMLFMNDSYISNYNNALNPIVK